MSDDPQIVHVTSVHKRNDIRIFQKFCVSLRRKYPNVSLIVADGLGDDEVEGIKIVDVGKPANRLMRVFLTAFKIWRAVPKTQNMIIHFHDPELLVLAFFLKNRGNKIIFDFHEDIKSQIMEKHYIPAVARYFVSKLYGLVEKICITRCDVLIGATPYICNEYARHHGTVVNVNNYPILGELAEDTAQLHGGRHVAYVGAISRIRGIQELVEAMKLVTTGAELIVAGEFNDKHLEQEVKNLAPDNVIFVGQKSRTEVKEILSNAFAGVVTFLPAGNHVNAQPNKMFEYMSAGLPLIVSDFEIWDELVSVNECGLSVDPQNPASIASAIDLLFQDRELAQKLGANGFDAVHREFRWDFEENKLLEVYKTG